MTLSDGDLLVKIKEQQKTLETFAACPTPGNPLSISTIDGAPRTSNKSRIFRYLFPSKGPLPEGAGMAEETVIANVKAKGGKIGVAVDFQFSLRAMQAKKTMPVLNLMERLYSEQVLS